MQVYITLKLKGLCALKISNRLKELPVHGTAFPLAIRPTLKQTFSIRSHALFLPFMTFIKNCFQSEILQTVNSTSSFDFVHLAKNNGALHFTDSIQYYTPTAIMLARYVTHMNTQIAGWYMLGFIKGRLVFNIPTHLH